MTAEADGARQTGPALEKMIQFVLWLIPAVEKFPQRQRFLLGDRIQTAGLDILEGLIEATYSRGGRLRVLETVNIRLEKLRILFRIAMELRYLDLRRYEHAARSLDEIGRLVGGWMKAQRGQTAP